MPGANCRHVGPCRAKCSSPPWAIEGGRKPCSLQTAPARTDWRAAGLRYFGVQLLPEAAFRRADPQSQRRRRLHLPERRRHRGRRWLHLLRQPQLQPQPPAAAADDRRADRRRHSPPGAALHGPAVPGLFPAGHEHLRPGRAAGASSIARLWPIRPSSAWPSARGPIACRTMSSICCRNWPARRIYRSSTACRRFTIARWCG